MSATLDLFSMPHRGHPLSADLGPHKPSEQTVLTVNMQHRFLFYSKSAESVTAAQAEADFVQLAL